MRGADQSAGWGSFSLQSPWHQPVRGSSCQWHIWALNNVVMSTRTSHGGAAYAMMIIVIIMSYVCEFLCTFQGYFAFLNLFFSISLYKYLQLPSVKYILSDRPPAKHFTCIVFSFSQQIYEAGTILSNLQTRITMKSRNLRGFPQIRQLVRGRAQIQSQWHLAPSLHSQPLCFIYKLNREVCYYPVIKKKKRNLTNVKELAQGHTAN